MSILFNLHAVQFVSDFGDQAVILPSAFAIAIVLLALGRARLAACWAAMVIASFGCILTMKLVWHACGSPLPHNLLRSPSGHTMAATVLYGGLVVLCGARRAISLAAALAIAVLIATTRLILGAHTIPEVVLAATIGLLAVGIFASVIERPVWGDRPRRWPYRRPLILLALLPVILLHGQRSRVELTIHSIAERYVGALLGCTRPAG